MANRMCGSGDARQLTEGIFVLKAGISRLPRRHGRIWYMASHNEALRCSYLDVWVRKLDFSGSLYFLQAPPAVVQLELTDRSCPETTGTTLKRGVRRKKNLS